MRKYYPDYVTFTAVAIVQYVIVSVSRQELDEIFDGRDDDVIQPSDLVKMHYFTRCIKESLRTHPAAPLVGRTTTTPIEIDGKEVPIGTPIDLSIWNLHHNPEHWEDPFVYNPDRFLPEKIQQMDPHVYLPFSAGPRNCIGQAFAMNTIKIIVGHVLRKFELAVDVTHDVKPCPHVGLSSETGIRVFFRARTSTNT